MYLQAGPGGLVAVQVLVLRGAVCEEESIVVRGLHDVRVSPSRVEAADEMTVIKINTRIHIRPKLCSFRDARVIAPAIRVTLEAHSAPAVDVDSGKERQPTRTAHDQTEMLVFQLPFIRITQEAGCVSQLTWSERWQCHGA